MISCVPRSRKGGGPYYQPCPYLYPFSYSMAFIYVRSGRCVDSKVKSIESCTYGCILYCMDCINFMEIHVVNMLSFLFNFIFPCKICLTLGAKQQRSFVIQLNLVSLQSNLYRICTVEPFILASSMSSISLICSSLNQFSQSPTSPENRSRNI